MARKRTTPEVETTLTQQDIEDTIFGTGAGDFPLKFDPCYMDALVMVYFETGAIRYPELNDDGTMILVYREYQDDAE